MQSLAGAMHYAHELGIIHRDLKPGNILLQMSVVKGWNSGVRSQTADVTSADLPTSLTPDIRSLTSDLRAKITDFGLAKHLDDESNRTQTGNILGTPSYMAPEQATGRVKDIGPPADTYALGAILYELLTGRPPFKAASTLDTLEQVRTQEPVPPSRLQPKTPRDLEIICLKCLEKEPVKRYDSAAALAEDLRRFLAKEPILARPVGSAERFYRSCRRNPVVAGLAAAVVFVLLAGIVVSTSFGLLAHEDARQAELARDKARTEGENARKAEGNATEEARKARIAEGNATLEAAKARAAKRDSDMEAARLKFRDAIGHAQAGAVDLGLYGLIEALQLAPDDADAAPFRRTLCTSFAFWSRQLPTLRYLLDNQDFGDVPERDTFFRTVGKDGKYFVVGQPGGQNIQLREMATGRLFELGWRLAGDETINSFTPDNALVLTRTLKEGKAFLQLRDTLTGKPAGPASPFGPDGFSQLPILVWSNGAVAAFDTAKGRRFWDLAGARWYPLSIPNESVTLPLVLSRDQKPLAVVFHPAPRFSQDTPRLEFWDVTTGKPAPFPVRLTAGSDERVTLDGRIFATRHFQSVDGQCRWWDLDTCRLIDKWYPRQVGGSQPMPDSQTLLANYLNERLGLFALDTGFQRGGNLAHFGRDFANGWVIGDPVFIYRAGGHGLRAWNTHTLALQATAAANPGTRPFAGDAVKPEHARELFGGGLLSPGGKLAFFNRTGTGREYWRISQALGERVTAIFNRTGTDQEYGRLVDVARRQPIGPALRAQRDRNLMVFSPDEQLLALAPHNYMSGAPAPEVHVYDAATGRLRLPPLRLSRFVLSLAFTPDSRTLVVGCVGQTVLLDARNGQPRAVLQQASVADQLAVSPEGKALAIGYRGGWPGDGEGVRLWDLTTAKPIGPFHPIDGLRQVSFMDQGRSVLVATVATDHTGPKWVNGAGPLHVFDRETGQPLAAALPPSGLLSNFWGTNIAARSRDAVFAFRSSAGTIEQWDNAAGDKVGEPMVHPCPVWRMQYSPDGRLLATICADNSVRLWDSATGLPLGPPLLHVAPVLSLCFAPVADAQKSGREAYHLVTASAAGDTHDWHLPAAFPDDPDRLTLWIEAAAGCKQGRTETALLDAATWRERCRQLEERWPDAAAALARQRGADLSAELAAWHEARASEAEATGNAYGLLWHLDRLAEQRPADWRLAARSAGRQRGLCRRRGRFRPGRPKRVQCGPGGLVQPRRRDGFGRPALAACPLVPRPSNCGTPQRLACLRRPSGSPQSAR